MLRRVQTCYFLEIPLKGGHFILKTKFFTRIGADCHLKIDLKDYWFLPEFLVFLFFEV